MPTKDPSVHLSSEQLKCKSSIHARSERVQPTDYIELVVTEDIAFNLGFKLPNLNGTVENQN